MATVTGVSAEYTTGVSVWDEDTSAYVLVAGAVNSAVMLFFGPEDPKTASGGRNIEGDAWWPTGAAHTRPGDVIERVRHNPASTASSAPTTSALIDLDATNLAVTFVVPQSGIVEITLECFAFGGSGSGVLWGLREGTTTVADPYLVSFGNVVGNRAIATFIISDLIPGTTKTYKWANSRVGSSSVTTEWGLDRGEAIMTVRAA